MTASLCVPPAPVGQQRSPQETNANERAAAGQASSDALK
jgi:hypothetical protein